MPEEHERPDEDEAEGERVRRGLPVIRTSIELEKDLYIAVKEEVARTNSSIRDFITKAAMEKLGLSTRPDVHKAPETEVFTKALSGIPFARRVLCVLERHVREPFSTAILMAKMERFDLDPEAFSEPDLTDSMIAELCRPVDFLCGPQAARALELDLKGLRGA